MIFEGSLEHCFRVMSSSLGNCAWTLESIVECPRNTFGLGLLSHNGWAGYSALATRQSVALQMILYRRVARGHNRAQKLKAHPLHCSSVR